MHRRLPYFLVASALAGAFLAPGAAHAAPPNRGDPAPPLTPEHTRQVPDGAAMDWSALGDRIVLLEFWGTWCGPCVAAMPHLNELAAELRDDGALVIAVTFEGPEVVDKFLDRRPIDGWVLCDTDRSIVQAYDVGGWPTTFLIQNGKVLARTHPGRLTAEIVRAYVAGEDPLELDADALATVTPPEPPMAPATLEVVVRPSVNEEGGWSTYAGGVVLEFAPVRQVVASLWDVEPSLVRAGDWAAEQRYDVTCRTAEPSHFAQHRPAMRALVAAAMGVRVLPREEEVPGYVMRAAPSGVRLPAAIGEYAGTSFQRDSESCRITGASMTLDQLRGSLESLLGAPIRDETGDASRYFVELRFDVRDLAGVPDALAAQAGLVLVPSPISTTVVYVERAEPAPAP